MNYEEFLKQLGVNIYDIPYITDADALHLAHDAAVDYTNLHHGSLKYENVSYSYIVYLSALLDRTANHLYNVLLENQQIKGDR